MKTARDCVLHINDIKVTFAVALSNYFSIFKIVEAYDRDPRSGSQLYSTFSEVVPYTVSSQNLLLKKELLQSNLRTACVELLDGIVVSSMTVLHKLNLASDKIFMFTPEEVFSNYKKFTESNPDRAKSMTGVVSKIEFVGKVDQVNLLKTIISGEVDSLTITKLTSVISLLEETDTDNICSKDYLDFIISKPCIDMFKKILEPMSAVGVDDAMVFVSSFIGMENGNAHTSKIENIFKAIDFLIISLSSINDIVDMIDIASN